jgi:hypothetical protein
MATQSVLPRPPLDAGFPKRDAPPPLRAVHTPNFPALLRQLGASLLVITYQAGKLVLVRDEGATSTPSSMPSRSRWAWPSTATGWPSAPKSMSGNSSASRASPPGRHDACYLPRSSHFMGNIQIHEMAGGHSPRAGEELGV